MHLLHSSCKSFVTTRGQYVYLPFTCICVVPTWDVPLNIFLFCGSQADLNCNIQDDTGAFYGVTSQYESSENMTITCSTKVCSFGKQVVEKVEVEAQQLTIEMFQLDEQNNYVIFVPLLMPCAFVPFFPSLSLSLDWICTVWEWTFCLQDKPVSYVWIHDQLHP